MKTRRKRRSRSSPSPVSERSTEPSSRSRPASVSRYGGRLLVDLLEHEGLVAALLGRLGVPLHFRRLALGRASVGGHELGALGGDADHVAVLEHRHLPRMAQEGGDGGGDEGLAVAVAHHQRRLVARADHQTGLVGRDGTEGAVALQTSDGSLHRCRQTVIQVLLHEVYDHFGVRLAT